MRKLLWFTVGFSACCAAGVYLLTDMFLAALALLCLFAGVLLLFVKGRAVKAAAAVLLGITAGAVWLLAYNAVYLQVPRQYDGETVAVSIEITDYSYETDYGIAAQGKLELQGKSYKVKAYFDEMSPLSPGDTVRGEYKLRLTAEGGLQEATYHQGEGIFLLAYARDEMTVQRLSAVPARYFAATLRESITDMLDRVFPEDAVGFARALLLGDSSLLTYEQDTAFKVSGIRHIVAVSGLHVSILFALVYTLAGKKRLLTALLGIPALLVFAAVAGFTPSITRACIMQSLMILSMLLKKEYDPPTALSFAVLTMLVINPMAITSVSLQLSVGCMVGIFLFSGKVSNYVLRLLGSPVGKSLKARLARWFAGSVAVTLSAMVVTTPLCAYYFGSVSIIGVLTNLLTLWAVSFIFYGIMLACLAGAVWLPLGNAVAAVTAWLMRFVLFMADALASLPMAAVYTCSIYIVLWIVLCYVLFAVFLFAKKKRPVLLAGCVVFALCVCLAASYAEPRLDAMRVTVLDVGQGQSILLQNKGKNYLVDCGGDSGGEAADIAAEQLLSQGITRLDGVILTHYDADHAGGVAYLLSRISTDALYLPDIQDDSGIQAELIDRYPSISRLVSEKRQLPLPSGAITLLPGGSEGDENESSLCILFQAENCDILITGDRSSAGERALLTDVRLPELELLVVGHHGSKSSTSFELLSVTMPKAAVISVGADNPYGHPAEDVVERLERFGCEVWRTDLSGTVVFRR